MTIWLVWYHSVDWQEVLYACDSEETANAAYERHRLQKKWNHKVAKGCMSIDPIVVKTLEDVKV